MKKLKTTKAENKHAKKLSKMIDERHPDMKVASGEHKGKDIKDLINS